MKSHKTNSHTISSDTTLGEKCAKRLINDAEFCRGNLIHQDKVRIAEIINEEINVAAAEQKEDTQIVNFLCKHLDGVKWTGVFPELRPRCGNDEHEEKYICASTFRKHLSVALHAVDQPQDLGSYEEAQ